MNKIEGATFENEFVDIDFSTYVKCRFQNCTIHTSAGYFGLEGCSFKDCRLSLGKPADNIARLIKLFFENRPIIFEKEK